jgi:hypothetical protein
MTSTNTEEALLKTDVLGRVKTPKNRRQELLDEFERSGISGAQYARIVGINYQTFATWVQGRRKQRGQYPRKTAQVKAPPQRWIEAVAQPADQTTTGSGLQIELPGGATMRISESTHAQLAAQVIAALRKETPAC